jgi:tetratricopeptide (TPR) repeat protein
MLHPRSRIGIASLAGVAVVAAALGGMGRARLLSLQLSTPRTMDLEGRMKALDEALQYCPWNDRVHYEVASELQSQATATSVFQYAERQKLLESARRSIVRALRLRPAQDSYWVFLGRIAGSLGDLKLAEAAFGRALELGRTNGYVQRDYAQYLLRRGEIDAAVGRLAAAREYAPALSLIDVLDLLAPHTGDVQTWQA